MFARNYWAFCIALGCAFFLTACGDLGMVLPSQGSYRVNAQVDGDYTLDAYSVVTKNSKIRPYFVNSVVNDPDVRGITVFVQDYSGTVVSRKVHYQLVVDTQKPAPQPESPAETLPEAPPETSDPATEGDPKGGPEGVPDEVPLDESSENEAAPPGETETAVPDLAEIENDGWTDTPEFSEEVPPELSGVGFDDPVAEPPADFPAEAPEDSFGGGETDGGDAWVAVDAAEAETGLADEADTIYAADTARDAATGDATDTTVADTVDVAGADTAGADTTDTDTVDVADANATGADATGADATGADTVDTAGADNAGADVPDPDSAGADAATTGVDTAGADTVVSAAPPAETLPVETPKPAPKPPIPEDETVLVKQLDQYFPAFRIVEKLDIGRYNLVFQVMGEKEILYRTFKPIYFLGDAKFALGEIQSFLPVAVTGGRLIPPGINVMLGIEISADPRLDPYVIWYNSKKIIAQGRLSNGANSLLWKTPEQTGFHSIRAEVFPLLPGDRMPGNMIGKIKELSLPVSAKSEGIRRFNDSSGEFISWHQLWGTLDDAKAPNNPERRLVSLYSQSPRWAPVGGMYGLLVGRDDGYTLPGTPFKLSRDEQGTGRILFHLAVLSEGSIINIRFAGGETSQQADAREDRPTGSAELDLSFAGNALILWIASDDASREESLELNGDEANGFITVVVEFTIAPDHFDAELRLENSAETTGPLSIALAAPVSSEGVIRFGGADYSEHKRNVNRPAAGQTGKYGGGTMALNELALSYARLSMPQKEEESDSEVPESLIVEEENPGAEPGPPSLNAL
jgi:hypothetical protein